jgi:hypothetical protein
MAIISVNNNNSNNPISSLNVFGFLALPELQEESLPYNTTGNYAMQDQRMALKWVQDNIKALYVLTPCCLISIDNNTPTVVAIQPAFFCTARCAFLC